LPPSVTPVLYIHLKRLIILLTSQCGTFYERRQKEHLIKELMNERQVINEMKESLSKGNQADEVMKESEQIFRTIFENASDGILLADNESKKFFMGNKQIYKTLGYGPDEIKALGVMDIHPEKDLPYILDQFEKLIRNEILVSKDIPVKKKDGSIYYADISALPIPLIGTTLTIGIFRDITERKGMEEALREKSHFIASLLHAIPVAVFYKDKEGRYLGCNGAFTEVMGVTTEQIRGKTVQELWPSELAEKYHHMDLELMRNREHQVYELQVKAKDGQMRPVIFAKDVYLDKDGEVAGLVGAFLDITERKQAEKTLKDNIVLLAEAERIGHTGSWKRDLATNKTFWSAETRRIFGIPENEEVLFETFKSRIHPEDRDDLLDKLHETEEKGIPFDAEYRIVLPDGTIRHILDKGETTFSIEGKPVIINGFVLDITERKKLENDLIKVQKLDSIGTLAGGIAHDYNNLLSVIMGNVDLAKMLITKNDPAYAVLIKAEQAALKARDLTQQLITFSQGGYPLSKIIDIRACLTQSVRLALSGSNIRPEWNIAEDLPEVKVDENQIRLVVQNIVINTREAMPQGGTLFIDVTKALLKPDNTLLLPQGVYIRLAFRDEGTGIPAEILPKVFDPYFTTKAMGASKGMGLGLSICYSIIKRHMGHIMLDSKEGFGTTVIIHIPAAMAHIEL
jgi:PAS domain S-box-containing protein